MRIIVCIDDNGGMMFNNRRVSSDKAVTDRIIDLLKGNSLYLNEYSAKLFLEKTDNLKISDDFLSEAGDNDYCFVENVDITEHISDIGQVIIYYWNRKYPSDFKFPKNAAVSGLKCVSVTEFSGNSHEKITEEVYE
ncbi:MAG: ribonuclease Z [Clostridia bacterium]|nr:ribonuclease Z [Clostridia bacterium]